MSSFSRDERYFEEQRRREKEEAVRQDRRMRIRAEISNHYLTMIDIMTDFCQAKGWDYRLTDVSRQKTEPLVVAILSRPHYVHGNPSFSIGFTIRDDRVVIIIASQTYKHDYHQELATVLSQKTGLPTNYWDESPRRDDPRGR
jgi:hypothetical protein